MPMFAATAAAGDTMTRPRVGSAITVTPIPAATITGVAPAAGVAPTSTLNSNRMPDASSLNLAVPAVPVEI